MQKTTAKIPFELIKDKTITTHAKILFTHIDIQADKNNTAKINLPETAKNLSLKKQTVLKLFKELARHGYIEFEKMKENGNYYTIKIKE